MDNVVIALIYSTQFFDIITSMGRLVLEKIYNVAKKMVEILKLDYVIIEPVTQEFFSKSYFARRPLFEVILNKGLHDKNYNLMRNWEDALKEYLEKYYV